MGQKRCHRLSPIDGPHKTKHTVHYSHQYLIIRTRNYTCMHISTHKYMTYLKLGALTIKKTDFSMLYYFDVIFEYAWTIRLQTQLVARDDKHNSTHLRTRTHYILIR